ncbi:hypothetical protein O988_03073 [Pseudogymnoascus sp. VKM F-3808]|nr:hypothetical protein O988_03073 [Pseudogymnoascus sp. VKM F-3808]
MSHPVYLIVYRSPIFAAHWALWVPVITDGAEGTVGKVLQVEGSASEGFAYEIMRNHDLGACSRRKSLVPLCSVDAAYVDDKEEDTLERLALSVPPPTPSLRSASVTGARTRVEMKNCQTWLRDVAVVMVENDVFPSEVLVKLDDAPKN